MTVTTIPSREFMRDVAAAKHATAAGPVFITERDEPAYVLLKIADYYELASEAPRSLLEVMDAIDGGDFEFEPPKIVAGLNDFARIQGTAPATMP